MSTSFATTGGALSIVAALALAAAGPAVPAQADHHPPPTTSAMAGMPAETTTPTKAAPPTKAPPTKAAKAKKVGKAKPAPKVPVKTLQVAQKNLKFNPTLLGLIPGDTVVWTNKETDDTTHSVVQGNGEDIDSPDIEPGQHFQWTFNFPGEWDIICRFHPDMFLTIKVVGKAVPGAVAPTHSTKPPPPANDTDPTSGVPGISGLPVAPPQPRRS
ncbi:MAG TPA: plastocyanin/azurin family copper-binding protein [Sporichthyaceae bacterium]|nr:plastocyanin/azurin family copper-binding protein [Sporichthyaceae bacterium]